MREAYLLPALTFTALAGSVAGGGTIMLGLFVLGLLLTTFDLLLTLLRG